ncbi:MAG TPA: ATP-binding protein [Pyrinomonadaceae bacterium]|nr:ATP-binding protein [Pyrinomonadaceae bacterium]
MVTQAGKLTITESSMTGGELGSPWNVRTADAAEEASSAQPRTGAKGLKMMNKQGLTRPFMYFIVAMGSAAVLFSAYRLPHAELDLKFMLLALMVVVCSRVAVPIPHVSGRITVSDTLIFLTMLLYGAEAAILLAAVEGVCSSLWISKKTITIIFNSAVLACSTFVTVWALRLCFGEIVRITDSGYTANFLVAMCLMALVQYVANTGLIAVEKSCKLNKSFWQTWSTYYLWTSITFFAGASLAGITAHLIYAFGFYAVLATVPIIAIIYLTYQTYLKNIEVAAAHAEQAERHVGELSLYINELKRSEEEREKILLREQAARSEAEAANRIKDQFLATLSHELRTPLTAIIGWSGLLRSNDLDADLRGQALETVERNARTQAQLIDDLLDVSRIVSGKLLLDVKEIELDKVVASAINVVRPAADAKAIRITFDKEPERNFITGDVARLQQIVWNLLSNAVKFTPEGGSVRIRLERIGSHIKLSVSDTGKGISGDFLPHVFDRFRQADSTTTRNYGGLGLGLAIVRHLVELHGGTVGAESDGEGRGATFSTTFPLLAVSTEMQSADAMGDARAFDSRFALEGLRVLVVDDEPDTRQVISAVISKSGAQVRACASVPEALETLKLWKPDILMSDIGMPDEDGYSLIRKVRSLSVESGGLTPAAALTAYARDDDRDQALAAGFQMHVAKPIGSKELIATVASLAGRAV